VDKVLATYIDGSVVLDEPVDWPNGTRVELSPTVKASEVQNEVASPAQKEIEALRRHWQNADSYGLDESLWPTTREGIEFLLAHMDAAAPLDLTPEQIEAMEREFEESKNLQKELTRKSWEELENLF
jgi:hypothetical protein